MNSNIRYQQLGGGEIGNIDLNIVYEMIGIFYFVS